MREISPVVASDTNIFPIPSNTKFSAQLNPRTSSEGRDGTACPTASITNKISSFISLQQLSLDIYHHRATAASIQAYRQISTQGRSHLIAGFPLPVTRYPMRDAGCRDGRVRVVGDVEQTAAATAHRHQQVAAAALELHPRANITAKANSCNLIRRNFPEKDSD